MRPPIVRALTSLVLLLLAAACGSGGQNRPAVVGLWPAAGDLPAGPLPFVRVDFNEPVRVLNERDYILRVDGADFGTLLRTFPDDPDSIYFYPSGRTAFPEDATVGITLRQGLVVNSLDHYTLEETNLTTTSGLEATLPVGVPGAVALVNCANGSTAETVPVPGTHEPVAVLSTVRGTTRRIWVQLDGAGGVGTSLAWFAPGDAGMTAVALTATGELTTPHGALVLGPRGRTLYAAFRDEGTDAIRLHAIDVATGMESDVLVLASQAADPAAVPRGLALAYGPTAPTLHAVTEDAAGATVARIALASFEEQDLDAATPGVQGIVLPAAGGPVVVSDTRTWVAPDGGTDLALAPASGSASLLAGVATGTTTALALAPDTGLILHGLTSFAGTEMLQTRTRGSSYNLATPVEVSDDIGGASSMATAVIGITWLQGSDTALVVLDTPGGAVLTEWAYAGQAQLEQLDLDGGFVGIQGLALAADVRVLGRNHGPFPD